MSIQVAVDGPAGAGKSTISKMVAKELNLVYIDTGAMYRTVALYAIRQGIDCTDVKAVEAILDDIEMDIRLEDGNQKVYLGDEDVSEAIRTPEVSVGASNVGVIPAVRIKLVELQRQLAGRYDVIMDGRDIGTYVLPNATVKIYLTASVEIRAQRRYKELIEKGTETTYEEVLEDMKFRDHNDANREFAPLRQAEDAVLADTGNLNIEESVELFKKIIQSKVKKVK